MNNKKIIDKIDKIMKKDSIPIYYKKYKPSKILRKKILDYHAHDNLFCDLLDKYVNSYHSHTHIICNFASNKTKMKKTKLGKPPTKFYYNKKTKIGKIVFYKYYQSFDSNDTKANNKHTNLINTFLQKYEFSGLILDFRLHKGGNMWPTIYGLQSILTNVPFNIFTKNDKVSKHDEYLSIDDKLKIKQIKLKTNKINANYPIAIIIGKQTYSSGEILSSIFSGKDNVKSFGKKSGGGLSINNTISITNNIKLNLTIALVRLTNGIFKEYLTPNVITNTPITDAKKWLLLNY